MPTVRWLGGTGNWNTGANWSGGSAPTNGDTIIFESGSVDVTTGPSSTITVAALQVTNGYSGNWTALVTLDTITALTLGGAGSLYRLSAPVTTALIDLYSQTTLSHEGGTWTTVTCSGMGKVIRSGTGVFTTLRNMPGVLVESTSATQTITTAINGGTIKSAGSIGTYTSMGGDRLTTTEAAAISTSATLGNGSSFNHLSSGTIALLNAYSGSSFPCAGSVKDFTITTANIYAGSSVNERPPGITVTISSKNYIGTNMAGFTPPPFP